MKILRGGPNIISLRNKREKMKRTQKKQERLEPSIRMLILRRGPNISLRNKRKKIKINPNSQLDSKK